MQNNFSNCVLSTSFYYHYNLSENEMVLRELLPSVLLLELLLDDFGNFNMEGKGEGVENVFRIKETHKIRYTSVYVRSTAPPFLVLLLLLLLFYQRE